MTEKAKATKPVCNSCKSENVFRDCASMWNPATHEHELIVVYDHRYCNDCGSSSIEDVEFELQS